MSNFFGNLIGGDKKKKIAKNAYDEIFYELKRVEKNKDDENILHRAERSIFETLSCPDRIKSINAEKFNELFLKAIQTNKQNIISFFLQTNKINFDILDGSDICIEGILNRVCTDYHAGTFRLLLATKKVNVGYYNKKLKDHYTPLMSLIELNNRGEEDIEIENSIRTLLLTGKSNIDYVNDSGTSAMDLAIYKDNNNIIRMLKDFMNEKYCY